MQETANDTLDLTALPFTQWEATLPTMEEAYYGVPFDSIHPLRETGDTVFRKSLFQRHSLQVKHNDLQPRPDNSLPAWVFGSLLLLTGLLCLYYRLRKIKITSLLKALIDIRAMDRLVRDNNLGRTAIIMPMGLLAVAVLCMPVHHMAMRHTGYGGYLLLTLAVMVLYLLRNGLLRLLGNTFDNKQAVGQYITSNYLYHLLEATVTLVLLYPFYYLPGAENAMLYIIAIFMATAFVVRFFRGMKVFLTLPKGSSFYLFYYLCIVETIPILVIIKWFIAQ